MRSGQPIFVAEKANEFKIKHLLDLKDELFHLKTQMKLLEKRIEEITKEIKEKLQKNV